MHADLRPLPTPITGQQRHLHTFDRGYDEGYRRGHADGHRVGRGEAANVYEAEIDAEAARVRLWVTWGMVFAFAMGGLFGVGVHALMPDLIAAGLLP